MVEVVKGKEIQLAPVLGTLTEMSWTAPPNMTFDQWKAAGDQLAQLGHALQWWVGDWWNAGEPYGDRVYEVERVCGKCLNLGTVRTYASIAKNVSIRIDTLTFAHHQLVASLKPAEQKHWLERAVAGDWTVREMRRALRGKADIPCDTHFEEYDENGERTDFRRAAILHIETAIEMAGLVQSILHQDGVLTDKVCSEIRRAARLWDALTTKASAAMQKKTSKRRSIPRPRKT